jgi:uncharacterized repeat protein (TIGR02543 family)
MGERGIVRGCKKFFLPGLLVVVAVMIMPLCAKDVFYKLMITKATPYGSAVTAYDYKEGDYITVDARIHPGLRFTGWTGPDADLLAEPDSVRTTFTMPGRDVSITANFEYDDGPAPAVKALFVNKKNSDDTRRDGDMPPASLILRGRPASSFTRPAIT